MAQSIKIIKVPLNIYSLAATHEMHGRRKSILGDFRQSQVSFISFIGSEFFANHLSLVSCSPDSIGSLRKNKSVVASSPQAVNIMKSIIYPEGPPLFNIMEAIGLPTKYVGKSQHQI